MTVTTGSINIMLKITSDLEGDVFTIQGDPTFLRHITWERITECFPSLKPFKGKYQAILRGNVLTIAKPQSLDMEDFSESIDLTLTMVFDKTKNRFIVKCHPVIITGLDYEGLQALFPDILFLNEVEYQPTDLS